MEEHRRTSRNYFPFLIVLTAVFCFDRGACLKAQHVTGGVGNIVLSERQPRESIKRNTKKATDVIVYLKTGEPLKGSTLVRALAFRLKRNTVVSTPGGRRRVSRLQEGDYVFYQEDGCAALPIEIGLIHFTRSPDAYFVHH
jgi:hypothetical protein